MENSCKENLKQSSEKWVIASVYPKFRRNSALRSTNADLYHYAGNCPVRYIDPDGRETKEDKARKMLYAASDFIINHAETTKEIIVADTLKKMMNNKKIQLDNIPKRKPKSSGSYGFYDFGNNTFTGKKIDIIVLDIQKTIDGGMAELIDTLSHEGTHAAHRQAGHNNNKVAEEIDSFNTGLNISNKYRKEKKFRIDRTKEYGDLSDPGTKKIIEKYEKKYGIKYDPSKFTELK